MVVTRSMKRGDRAEYLATDEATEEEAVAAPEQITKSRPGKRQKCRSVFTRKNTDRLQPQQNPTTVSAVNSRSYFLDLPAELRNQIYDLALRSEGSIPISASRPYLREPGLLSANRQIREETFETFYGTNVFDVEGSSPCMKFLRSLSDRVIKSMRKIHIVTSNTAASDPRTWEWLKHVQARLASIHHNAGKRGLGEDVIYFPLTVDGQGIWANASACKATVGIKGGLLGWKQNEAALHDSGAHSGGQQS